MKDIKSILSERKIVKKHSERAAILEMMLTELNKERKLDMNPLKARTIAIKVGHVKTEDLWDFHRTCVRYQKEKGSYGKCWWGSLKVRE